MGLRDFITKKALERQLKKMPEEQRTLFRKMFEKNPALFERIAQEIAMKKRKGQDETLASVAVMKKYESEMRTLAMQIQRK